MKLLYALVVPLAACFQAFAVIPDTLLVGTNAEFPPFTYIQDGEVVGFDIDVAKEVCKRLKKEMKIKDVPFEAVIPDVITGQVHFVAAGVSHTEERAKKVLFPKAHLTNDPLIALRLKKEGNGTPISLQEMKGKRVIVNDGYTADLYLSAKTGLDLVRLATVADAFIALKSKRADYFVTAKSTFNAYALRQPIDQFEYSVLADNPENYSLAVSKKYPELLPEVEKALKAMTDDGTLKAIKKKWQLDD